jgi:hypothetical protein
MKNKKLFGIACFLSLIPTLLLSACSHVEKIGNYEVQKNNTSGTLKLKQGDNWIENVKEDPGAANASKESVTGVTFTDITWGEKGLVCAKAKPQQAISGKIAMTVEIYDRATNKRLRDKSLRVVADWPQGAETPFVLNTTLATPEVKDTYTKITAEAILSTE